MKIEEESRYYESVFSEYMSDFIRYKRAQGLKYTTTPRTIRRFSRFIAAKGINELSLEKDLIEEWLTLGANEHKRTQQLRIIETTQFLIYLSERGISVYLPRPIRSCRSQSSFVPYIFSNDELTRFFKVCDGLKARAPSRMPVMLPVLFRLLFGCGLRISEALRLKLCDVDLDAGILFVHEGKGNKDRLVPISKSLLQLLQKYNDNTHKILTDYNVYFFAHKDGRSVEKDNIYRWFRKILWVAGISHGGRGSGPRVHDFRHTFSVYSLKAMTDKGMDIYCSLPILSTYLGHSSISATGKYVRLTQDMFPEIISKVNAITAFVIPGGEQS